MRKPTYLFIAILCLTPFLSDSQDDMSQPVPMDTAVHYGQLGNGMTYYIRHNEEPKERASFYMIQNVGALLEEDNQNGLAHFLEHMAFNGTEHFEGKGIINTLEKHGVAFGRNINAYTSFNETVYNLSDIPVTLPGLVDTCLLILNDWSNYLLLTDEEIDAERGVITEEWRTRRNADFRMREKYFPVLLKGSKFAVRDVIGNLDVIKNFKYETLRKFYHDWYRTDLQAIAIVGDINPDEVEKKVKELFSKIPAVQNEKYRPFFKVPPHKETRFVLATDAEASQYSVSIYIKHDAIKPEDKDLDYIRSQYIENLFNMMLRERISELLQKGEPPFVIGRVGHGSFVRGYDVTVISAIAKPNMEDVALRSIYTEAQRVVKHGFTASEFDRAKINLLTSMENAYKQRDKIRNDSYAHSFKSNYLINEPVTSAEFDWEFGQKVLKTIMVEEVSAKAKDWIVPENRVVIVQGPEGADVKHLTKEEALGIITDVENSEIKPYEDTGQVASLIDEELPGSKVVATRKLDDLDAVEWKLANNATVVYRHADFEKDNVILFASSPGGSSLFDADKIASAIMLNNFIDAFGVGKFDAITLKKILTGKKVSLNAGLSDLNETFSGSSTPKDFETMMQLLYLQFAHPRFDKEAYEALRSRYIAYLANQENSPRKIMSDSMSMILSNYNKRTKLVNSKLFDEVSFAQMEKLYNDRFIDAGDFTFFIVGNIDEETAKSMAEKYIGSLKDNPREENWVDRKVRGPKGKTVKEITIPLQTKKATVFVNFTSNFAYTPENNLELKVLQGILRLRYTEEIREKEGGTYGVRVSANSQHFPVEEKSLQMNFDTAPEKGDYLKSLVYGEIDKVIKNGPTQEDLDKVVKNLKKDHEQAKQHNSYWLKALSTYYQHGFNPDAKENFEDILDGLTTQKIQQFAKKFIATADTVDVVFKPLEEK
ncbi:MAG: insulinase family protein [Chlorobi bacterium]|nr:insulinase family protein [Chlorobiota bacterium]